jgi:hypothetical protein
MSEDQWQWLLARPFGAIMFSTAGGDKNPPIPAICADGDLDGDLYLVLWDKEIVRNINERDPVVPIPKPSIAAGSQDQQMAAGGGSHCDGGDKNWLDRARELMLDPDFLAESSRIPEYYKLAEGIFKETGSMDSVEYVKYATAYLQALDYGKHGGEIKLP